MSDLIVDTDMFATYLGVTLDTAQDERAELILEQAQALCEAVVTPLPDGAAAVVLDVATRAWSNPTNAQSQGAGPYNASYGAVAGGLWLTRQNRQTLRNLNGGGGAYTIDLTPAGALENLPWWDLESASPAGDWDVPA